MSGLARYMPAIPLGEFVDYIYVDPSARSVSSLQEFARPTHPLVTIPAGAAQAPLQPGKLKGVFTQALNNEWVPGHLIGIRFKPYGIYTGFGIRGEAVANRVIPSSVVFSDIDPGRAAEMLEAGDELSAVAYVHDVLYNRLEPNPFLYEITEMVDALVETDLAKNSQRQLAQAFERSPKSFIEVFKKAIGITPLHYLHIHKVAAAKRLLREQPAVPLTEVGYMLGFYDQSHFIRVFKSHTGYTPFQYRSAPDPDRG